MDEHFQPLSRSPLWALLARYFREKGIDAWRSDEVPHYVTNNPVLATAYAEVVFAMLLDLRRAGRFPAASGEPLHICELGAGTGRLAFHFLRHLVALCEEAGLGTRAFRYVLTDQAEVNLGFWEQHAGLQRFFRAGVLDTAVFDANVVGEMRLRRHATRLAPGALDLPLVVVANYVFDGLPQDLLHIDSGRAWQCEAALDLPQDHAGRGAAELLASATPRFERRAIRPGEYPEPWLRRIVDGYRCALDRTHVLLPVAGLRCVDRLAAFSRAGMMLLTADKGAHRLNELQGRGEPVLVHHGSFSVDVNYHAFKAYCDIHGGSAWFPARPHRSLDIGACMVMDDAPSFHETRRACERHLGQFSPDDFFVLTRHAHATVDAMDAWQLVGYLRLSRYDPHQCMRYLPRLRQLAPNMDAAERSAVTHALGEVWDAYYPLGEAADLADLLARVFYEMQDYERALSYFTRSAQLQGPTAATTVNMAACCYVLGLEGKARRLAQRALQLDPSNAAATALLAAEAVTAPTAAA